VQGGSKRVIRQARGVRETRGRQVAGRQSKRRQRTCNPQTVAGERSRQNGKIRAKEPRCGKRGKTVQNGRQAGSKPEPTM